MELCSSAPASAGVVAWSWEVSGRNQCWCKSSLTPDPFRFTDRRAGPVRNQSIANVPLSAQRVSECYPGYGWTQDFSQITDGKTQVCTAAGTWIGTLTLQCSDTPLDRTSATLLFLSLHTD
jgi:hypothetical protein